MMKKDRIERLARTAGWARGWHFESSRLSALEDSVELMWHKDRGGQYFYCAVLNAFELRDTGRAIDNMVRHLERADEDCYRQYRAKEKAPNTSEVLEALPPEWGEVCM